LSSVCHQLTWVVEGTLRCRGKQGPAAGEGRNGMTHDGRRHIPRRRAVISGLVLLALVASPVGAADPWYRDVAQHWAEEYIRCLWEERVADGSLEEVLTWSPGWGLSREWQSRFHPDKLIDRGQYAMLLAKAFRLTPAPGQTGFLDVPPGYETYPGKNGQPFIDAARLAGLVTGYPGGYFRPAQSITREEAVAILIRGLGLRDYAHGLGPEEVRTLLGRFIDGFSVSQWCWPEMAAAIKLRIIVGYPDGTVRPQSSMTRAEAATVVFRSCLLVLTAAPNPFSPDGDGVDDFTVVTVQTLRNRSIRAWEINVTDYSGHVLRTLGQGTGQPPGFLLWNGQDNLGNVLPDGTYYLGGYAVDAGNHVHRAPMHPVRLEQARLWGSLEPSLAGPGHTVKVNAGTTGGALWVIGHLPSGARLDLAPGSAASDCQWWQGSFAVPLDFPDGTLHVVLQAGFGRTERTARLACIVYQPLPLVAWVVPDPARAGSTAVLWAEVGFPATAVTAAVDGLPELSLGADATSGRWAVPFPVLSDWLAGRRSVLVTGSMPGRTRTITITFNVEREPTPPRFFLSD